MTQPPRQYYDDGLVQLDRHALTLRRYHFPSGTSKVIPVQLIRDYRTEPLGLVIQRFRIWGSSDLRRWLPLDVPGTWPSPAFTPADPSVFLAMLDEVLQR